MGARSRPLKRKRGRSRSGYNPAITAAVLEIVENQLRDNNPPEVRQTLERLIKEGHSEAVSRRYIGIAVLFMLNDMAASGTAYDDTHYVEILNRLPDVS